jgi:hypothetical protein
VQIGLDQVLLLYGKAQVEIEILRSEVARLQALVEASEVIKEPDTQPVGVSKT